MTNRDVFKAFAERREAEGGTVRSARADGALVLYSYGTPVALRPDDEPNAAWFSESTHSPTTAKQMSQARAMCQLAETHPDAFFAAALRDHGVTHHGRLVA